MLFQLPTLDQAIYRVMRLRRLIAVAVAVPFITLLLVSTMNPAILPATEASLAILGVSALIVTHAILFPNVTLETLSLSFAATALIVLMPLLSSLALWAPVEQQSGAFALLVLFAVAVAGVLVVLLHIGLGAIAYAGPVLSRVLHLQQALPCSTDAAFQQLALRPATRRGRVLTGQADENGFFDVAVALASPEGGADHVRVDAKVLTSSPQRHDVMLLTRAGAMTVTSLGFSETQGGCIVDVRDMPGDFTLGMYALFWLTDQQADNLTEMTDALFGRAPRANGLAHHGSLMSFAGAILSPRTPMVD